MCTLALWIVCFSSLFGSPLSCYDCFVNVASPDVYKMCVGCLSIEGYAKINRCYELLKEILHGDAVVAAGKVDPGYERQLGELMNAEIQTLVKYFTGKNYVVSVYEERIKIAAENFIAAASRLPKGTLCIPPCGFQTKAIVYSCFYCMFGSCGYPLDCPVEEIQVNENSRSQIRCDVRFTLPEQIEVVWRFAEEVKTQKLDHFKEQTAGEDRLYSIQSTRMQHQGTYQCEIYSDYLSVVRLYYYLNVTPQLLTGHTKLQEIFDLSLLPGERLLPVPEDDYPPSILPSNWLLTACLTAVLLLFFLSLGTLYWATPENTNPPQERES